MNTPEDLAAELNMSAKVLRAWLRRHYPRPASSKWSRWELTDTQIRAARGHWTRSARKGGQGATQRLVTPQLNSRSTSDEAYVLDLCDDILAEQGLRQYRFSWLLGDPGSTDRKAPLPVNAYYPEHNLVIEYRERQHYEAVPFFDRRQTISGIGRGDQRRRYDERRELEVPSRGIPLVVIKSSDLDADSRGRLRRNRVADIVALRGLFRSAELTT